MAWYEKYYECLLCGSQMITDSQSYVPVLGWVDVYRCSNEGCESNEH